jgi:hypothetical protein
MKLERGILIESELEAAVKVELVVIRGETIPEGSGLS